MAPPSIAAWAPELSAEAAAALPRRRPLLLRRAGAVAAAVVVLVVTSVPVPGHQGVDDPAQALRALAPWALALPWLKRLDLRPVLWFFLCLLCPVFPAVLAGKVAYRALSLPYRDWTVEQWHAGRVRAVRGVGAVVVVSETVAVPGLPAGEAAWRTAMGWAWAAVLAWFCAAAVADVLSSTTPLVQPWWVAAVGLLGLTQLVGEFVLGLREPRRDGRPQPSSAVTSAEE